MRLNLRQHRSTAQALSGFLALALPLVLAALACNFLPSGDQTLRQTDIALGIQQTFVAQTGTAIVIGGSSAPALTFTPNATSTSQNASPTLSATATFTSLPPSVTPLPTTVTPSPAPTAIPIAEWGLHLFVPLSSGCKVANVGCWRMDDDWRKISSDNNLYMVSKNAVRIDSGWANPYLVFWHRYQFEDVAQVDIQGNAQWSTMKHLDKLSSGTNWKQEAINLDMFKGKEIIVRFSAVAKIGAGEWLINDVQVIPDYKP